MIKITPAGTLPRFSARAYLKDLMAEKYQKEGKPVPNLGHAMADVMWNRSKVIWAILKTFAYAEDATRLFRKA